MCHIYTTICYINMHIKLALHFLACAFFPFPASYVDGLVFWEGHSFETDQFNNQRREQVCKSPM